jgi:hypothetical protein
MTQRRYQFLLQHLKPRTLIKKYKNKEETTNIQDIKLKIKIEDILLSYTACTKPH